MIVELKAKNCDLTTRIDPDDFQDFGHLPITIFKDRTGSYRAQCYVKEKKRQFYLARLVASKHLNLSITDDTKVVHHIDGCPLNNTKANLRVVSYSENTRLGSVLKPRLRGISYHKRRKTWSAYYHKRGRQISLGSFKTQEEAIAARTHHDNTYYAKT